jgi:hypothetical protein
MSVLLDHGAVNHFRCCGATCCLEIQKKKPLKFSGFFFCSPDLGSDLLDLLQHLEHRLGRAHEKTLVILAQTTTLKRVATGAFTFSSHDLPLKNELRNK